jgi:hypothetical protein
MIPGGFAAGTGERLGTCPGRVPVTSDDPNELLVRALSSFRKVLRLAPALGISLLAVSLSGCSDGPDCDVAEILGALAGPDAVDCGAVNARSAETADYTVAHDCVAGIAGPFIVSLDLAVSDGRIAVGYAGDGDRLYRIDYTYAMGFMPPYIDSESLRGVTCARLEDLGSDCDSLYDNLCFDCREPDALELPPCDR